MLFFFSFFSFLFLFHLGFFVILMYAFIILVLLDCRVDFDVDIVQHRELVNFYGV